MEEYKKRLKEGVKTGAFAEILKEIEEYHKKMDDLLKDCNDAEKAFILGTYVWRLRSADKTT